MKIQLITELAELNHCQQQWNAVAGTRPFFRFEWLVQWLQHQIDPVQPAVLIGIDDHGQWHGIAPFCVSANSLVRKLRFLGSGKTCSDYLNIFSTPDSEPQWTQTVTQWLRHNLNSRGPLGRIDVVECEGISRDQPHTKHFIDTMEQAGFRSHHVAIEGCWVTQLPDSWEAMNAGLSKSFRRKTKKAVQRLAEHDSEILSSSQRSLDELWPDFVDLHQRRRKMLGETGCFADKRFETFLRQAVSALSNQNLAELVVIKYQQIPLASFLVFNDGENAFLYQSGIDVDRISLEPGHQIAVAAIQNAIAKGYRSFDFLRGDEPYKSRWLTKRVPLSRTRFIPRTLTARLKHDLWQTGRALKQTLTAKPKLPTEAVIGED